MTKKRIYLDFDGVLNTQKHQRFLRENNLPTSDKYGYLFDPEAVSNLQTLVEKTQATIIITSSWQLEGEDNILEMWKARNLPSKIVWFAPKVLSNSVLHRDKNSFVVFDDMPNLIPSIVENYIQINPETGITSKDIEQACLILF